MTCINVIFCATCHWNYQVAANKYSNYKFIDWFDRVWARDVMTTTRVCAHLHTPTDKSVSNTRVFKIERLRLPIVWAALANQKVTNLSLLECLKFQWPFTSSSSSLSNETEIPNKTVNSVMILSASRFLVPESPLLVHAPFLSWMMIAFI